MMDMWQISLTSFELRILLGIRAARLNVRQCAYTT